MIGGNIGSLDGFDFGNLDEKIEALLAAGVNLDKVDLRLGLS